MQSTWQLQDAKNRFSEVVNRAITDGPQEISRHGKKTAVVLSISEYQKLKRKESTGSISNFFRHSPLTQIVIERTKDYPREVTL
jgi:antitoxin Phd